MKNILLLLGAGSVLLASAAATARPAEQSELDLDSAVAPYSDTGEFSGVVMLGRGGREIWSGAYGMASVELSVPSQPQLRYKLHSSSKSILAVAVMRAVDQGRLDIDAPLCIYLDPCAQTWGAITLRHLLSHTSGIADITNDMVDGWRGDIASTIAALYDDLSARPLESVPGEVFSYSNFGFTLISLVLEQQYDMPIHDVLRVEVFEPAGMVSASLESPPETGLMYDGHRIEPLAVPGYNGRPDHLQQAYSKMYVIPGAGGVVASAQDCISFLHAVFEGDLISEAALADMLTVPFPDASDVYALGWVVGEARGEPAYGHSGGNNGFIAYLQYRQTDGLALVLLSNRGFTPLRDMLSDIRIALDE
ncbi:serine hydrolase domain-containing protein [Glycocaulis alkaliphilus]|uniref:serine hydrolase domain-containing protein n=1 Tax=Glycocaulis alkaliphilus TaxID=1434191 RepID=UPI000FD8B5A1|nr:serine hydrolase domain-containing protein [Glycocaulis alkaliphilus]GGB73454.1 serine hydrolase [Glycocaulis alkaliphilus]